MRIRASIRRLVGSITNLEENARHASIVLSLLLERETVIDMTGENTRLIYNLTDTRFGNRKLSGDEAEWIVQRLIKSDPVNRNYEGLVFSVLARSHHQGAVPFFLECIRHHYSNTTRISDLHWCVYGLCSEYNHTHAFKDEMLNALHLAARHDAEDVNCTAISWLRIFHGTGQECPPQG